MTYIRELIPGLWRAECTRTGLTATSTRSKSEAKRNLTRKRQRVERGAA